MLEKSDLIIVAAWNVLRPSKEGGKWDSNPTVFATKH